MYLRWIYLLLLLANLDLGLCLHYPPMLVKYLIDCHLTAIQLAVQTHLVLDRRLCIGDCVCLNFSFCKATRSHVFGFEILVGFTTCVSKARYLLTLSVDEGLTILGFILLGPKFKFRSDLLGGLSLDEVFGDQRI